DERALRQCGQGTAAVPRGRPVRGGPGHPPRPRGGGARRERRLVVAPPGAAPEGAAGELIAQRQREGSGVLGTSAPCSRRQGMKQRTSAAISRALRVSGCTSHTLAVSLPVTMRVPSGLKTTEYTAPTCPKNHARSVPCAASHT